MKRGFWIVLAAVAVAAAVGGGLALCAGPRQRDGDKKDEVRKIPLESIYATNGQKGLKKPEEDMAKVFERADKVGASTTLLVRGNDLATALKVTSMIFTGAADSDLTIGPNHRSTPQEQWLVAYFGIATTNPPAVLVDSVEILGKVIRFRFSRPVLNESNNEKQWICFWAPTGELTAGSYELELFDLDRREVVFMRRMKVQQSEKAP